MPKKKVGDHTCWNNEEYGSIRKGGPKVAHCAICKKSFSTKAITARARKRK